MAAAPAVGALVGATLTGWSAGSGAPGGPSSLPSPHGAWRSRRSACPRGASRWRSSSWPWPARQMSSAPCSARRSSSSRPLTRSGAASSAVHILVVTSGPRLGDAEAAAVAAIAGPQFSVVSGGILCLVGLAEVVRRFPSCGPTSTLRRSLPSRWASPGKSGRRSSCRRHSRSRPLRRQPDSGRRRVRRVGSRSRGSATDRRRGRFIFPGPLREQLVQLGQVGGRALALEDAPRLTRRPADERLPAGATARKSSSLIASPTSIRRSR